MKKLILRIAFCFGFALFFICGFLNTNQQNTLVRMKDSNSSTITIPTTISAEAQNALKNITTQMPEFVTPGSNDLKGWEEMNKQISAMSTTQSQSLVDSFEPNITYTKLGNVPVLDIKPKDWVDNGKVLVYVHGGGYTHPWSKFYIKQFRTHSKCHWT